MTTYLPKEDWQWLVDVHKVDIADAVVIVLHGSEDAPSKVEVYGRDHYQAIPLRVYGPDEEGKLAPITAPVAYTLEEPDFYGLRAVWNVLNDKNIPITPDRRRTLADKMHVHLHNARHV